MDGRSRALVALSALALLSVGTAFAAAPAVAPPPGTKTVLRVPGDPAGVAFDGPRVALLLTPVGRPSARPALTVRRMDGGPVLPVRYSRQGACKRIGCDGYPEILLAGTQVATFETGAGNTEAWGTWEAAAAPGRARLIRDWHAFGPGAGNENAFTNWSRGRGIAGQGTLLVYGTPKGLERFGATRSRVIAKDIVFVWDVNKQRIVVERPGHTLAVLDGAGKVISELAGVKLPADRSGIRNVLLQGNDLVVLDGNDLTRYDATTGEQGQTYHLGVGAASPTMARGVVVYERYVGHPRILRLSDGVDKVLPGVPSRAMRLSERGLDAARRTTVNGRVGVEIVHVPWSGLDAVLG